MSPEAAPGLEVLDLASLRQVQLGLLDDLAAVCLEHGLAWFLHGGTLLGAVRHRGYIPWDDDVDVVLPRRDYERLRELAAVGPLRPGVVYRDERSDHDFPLPFAKLGRAGTLLVDHGAGDLSVQVNIDVFPMDGWAQGRLGSRWHESRLNIVKTTVEWAVGPSLPGWKGVVSAPVRLLGRWLGVNRLARHINAAAARNPVGRDGDYGDMTWGVPVPRLPARHYARATTLTFAGRSFPAPSAPEEILARLYGADFRELPPVEERHSPHHFTAYRLVPGGDLAVTVDET